MSSSMRTKSSDADTSVHGVCISILDLGILLIGASGIGKSECALELVTQGHSLIADDIVNIRKEAPDSLVASAPATSKNHLEIRGLGILNVLKLFGPQAVRDEAKLELVIEILEWDPQYDYERVGITDHFYRILDRDIPLIQLPIREGRSLSTIVEVAARNQLLKNQGFNAAQEFQEKLLRKLKAEAKKES